MAGSATQCCQRDDDRGVASEKRVPSLEGPWRRAENPVGDGPKVGSRRQFLARDSCSARVAPNRSRGVYDFQAYMTILAAERARRLSTALSSPRCSDSDGVVTGHIRPALHQPSSRISIVLPARCCRRTCTRGFGGCKDRRCFSSTTRRARHSGRARPAGAPPLRIVQSWETAVPEAMSLRVLRRHPAR